MGHAPPAPRPGRPGHPGHRLLHPRPRRRTRPRREALPRRPGAGRRDGAPGRARRDEEPRLRGLPGPPAPGGRRLWRRAQRDGVGRASGALARGARPGPRAHLRAGQGALAGHGPPLHRRQRLRPLPLRARRDSRRPRHGALLHRPRPEGDHPVRPRGPGAQPEAPLLGLGAHAAALDEGQRLLRLGRDEGRPEDLRRLRALPGEVRRGLPRRRESRWRRWRSRTSRTS